MAKVDASTDMTEENNDNATFLYRRKNKLLKNTKMKCKYIPLRILRVDNIAYGVKSNLFANNFFKNIKIGRAHV